MVENVGIVLNLEPGEYLAAIAKWEFHLPGDVSVPLDKVYQYKYVAIAVEGKLKAVAVIAEWRINVREKAVHAAAFDVICRGPQAQKVLPSKIDEINYLSEHQLREIEGAMSAEAEKRPSELPPCLDLEEAAEAVARRFGLHQSQVEITIHRKRVCSSEQEGPSESGR